MDLGVIFPTTVIGTDPAVIRDFAQTAEGLGYRRLLTYDHVLGAVHADRDPPLVGPYTENDPFHEPFVLLGFLAGRRGGCALRRAPDPGGRDRLEPGRVLADLGLANPGQPIRVLLFTGACWGHGDLEAAGEDHP